jgi:hypothetical protein
MLQREFKNHAIHCANAVDWYTQWRMSLQPVLERVYGASTIDHALQIIGGQVRQAYPEVWEGAVER